MFSQITATALSAGPILNGARLGDVQMTLQHQHVVAALALLLHWATLMPVCLHAQGVAASGVGPVNRSMAGASTAAPLDSAGAIYWNPATIGALSGSEVSVGMEFLLPSERLSSAIAANAFGAGLPPVDLAGSTRGEPGVLPIPNIALVHLDPDSCLTYGFGVLSVGGFAANYPASVSNPILTAQPPLGFGLGRIEALAQVIQLVPTVACRLTDRFHVGFAPTVTMARVSATPGILAAPDDANGDTFATYEPATGTRFHWGGGFQCGAYYEGDDGFNYGVSFKSPQWLEPFRFNSTDELGNPRVLDFDFDYPPIVSLGLSYVGNPCWVLACDVRYFGWSGTTGFGESGFRPDGSVAGLGWRDIWSVHIGAQRQIACRTFLRMGYSYNENPVTEDVAYFNVASSSITQHVLYAGFTTGITRSIDVHFSFMVGFENESSGPFVSPAGPVPGATVTNELSAYAAGLGATVRF